MAETPITDFGGLIEVMARSGAEVILLGAIDLLGEVAGGGAYDDILPHTERVALFDAELRCASLPMLIRMKRAAGRAKDLDMLAGLEALQEERDRATGG